MHAYRHCQLEPTWRRCCRGYHYPWVMRNKDLPNAGPVPVGASEYDTTRHTAPTVIGSIRCSAEEGHTELLRGDEGPAFRVNYVHADVSW